MTVTTEHDRKVVLATALQDAWTAVEHTLTGNLSAICGISFSEYRLVSALAAVGERGLSRVDLGREVGLTPSAVTRALRPLDKRGMVTTTKDQRDARRAIARLTPAGLDVVVNASRVVSDAMVVVTGRTPTVRDHVDGLVDMLDELANA